MRRPKFQSWFEVHPPHLGRVFCDICYGVAKRQLDPPNCAFSGFGGQGVRPSKTTQIDQQISELTSSNNYDNYEQSAKTLTIDVYA
jgi:hypothetical protein